MGEGIATVEHLIVVSGPSGAGKSTFLEQMLSGDLPRDIRNRLPKGAGAWTQVYAIQHSQWLPPLADVGSKPATAGLVLHYDLTRRWNAAIRGYATDPALRVFDRAETVTVILIRPDHDRLVRQWAFGKTNFGSARNPANWRRLDRLSQLLWPTRPWLCGLRRRLRGTATKPVRRLLRHIERTLAAWQMPNSSVLGVYLRPDGADKVNSLYRDWQAFLAQRDRSEVAQIHVRPATGCPIGSSSQWTIFGP